MIDRDRAVLREFSSEMLEHVAACEQVLVRASTDPVHEQDYHLLLRSMHSMKGLARVLAATGLEQLAHAAEALLIDVRDGRRALAPVREVLLHALDALGTARAQTEESWQVHRPPRVPVPLRVYAPGDKGDVPKRPLAADRPGQRGVCGV